MIHNFHNFGVGMVVPSLSPRKFCTVDLNLHHLTRATITASVKGERSVRGMSDSETLWWQYCGRPSVLLLDCNTWRLFVVVHKLAAPTVLYVCVQVTPCEEELSTTCYCDSPTHSSSFHSRGLRWLTYPFCDAEPRHITLSG